MNSIAVTIGIVTYNSSKFVLETLDSVFEQTYGPIHLVISDDCSTDDSLVMIHQWLAQYKVKKRFLSIQLLTVARNTGVSANCNRVIHASKTNWIKFIAGDDILLKNCIEKNLNFVKENNKVEVLFSQVEVYCNTFEPCNYLLTSPGEFPSVLFKKSVGAAKQFKILLECDRIHFTPSYFFHKKALERVGFYDESECLVEDYPMWLKLTNAGIRLYYFHTPTVGYRVHGDATNNIGGDMLFKPSVINNFGIRQKYAHPYLSWTFVKQETWTYWVTVLFKNIGITKGTIINYFLYRGFTIYLNPFFWMNTINSRITSA